MPTAASMPRFAQETRLRFLDGLLFWEGRANRRDLMDAFQLSEPQAALDLKQYLARIEEGQVEYDTRCKRYVAGKRFRPLFGVPPLGPWLERAANAQVAVDALPTLVRASRPELMALFYRAVRDRAAVSFDYQAMKHLEGSRRTITATALVSDGLRWHVRGFCHDRRAYRDFVLTRMHDACAADASSTELPDDVEWSTWVELVLVPSARLSEGQAAAVRWDFDMDDDRLVVTVRLALEFYAMKRWGLNQPDSRLEILDRRVRPTLERTEA